MITPDSKGRPFRIKLADGTVWPHPDAEDSDLVCSGAYRALLTHPWGTEVSRAKVRELRRELRQAAKVTP